MLLDRPLEEPTTLIECAAFLAFWKVEILPIRDGLLCIWPQGAAQDAKLMVVDRYSHIAHREIVHGFFEFQLIVERINPKLIDVPWCISNVFEPHQRHMFNE